MAVSNFSVECRNISMDEKNITMVQGDTLCFGVEILDQNGVPLDVDLISFVCRKTYDDTSAVFDLSIGNGITRLDEGLYSVKVPAEATGDGNVYPGLYVHDLRVVYGANEFTIFHGTLEILSTAFHPVG